MDIRNRGLQRANPNASLDNNLRLSKCKSSGACELYDVYAEQGFYVMGIKFNGVNYFFETPEEDNQKEAITAKVNTILGPLLNYPIFEYGGTSVNGSNYTRFVGDGDIELIVYEDPADPLSITDVFPLNTANKSCETRAVQVYRFDDIIEESIVLTINGQSLTFTSFAENSATVAFEDIWTNLGVKSIVAGDGTFSVIVPVGSTLDYNGVAPTAVGEPYQDFYHGT